MKRDILQNQYHTTGLFKMLFADLVCFLLVTICSVSFCYSYFSDKVDVTGNATMAFVDIEYRSDPANDKTQLTAISALVNDEAQTLTTDIKIVPGDTLTIKGYAVNTSNVSVYALAKLEIVNKDSEANIIDKEVLWYTIGQTGGKHTLLHVERGLFQAGATLMDKNTSQELDIDYVFEGERYNNAYETINITLTLHSYQADHLNSASDYNNYKYSTDATVNPAIYASHMITGKKRDIYDANDSKDIESSTIDELEMEDENTYLINTCRDWLIVRQLSSYGTYFSGKTFKLNAYLDFCNNEIQKNIYRLDASLQGQGYTISNWNDTNGLITYMYGNIANVGVDGLKITNTNSSGHIGGLCAVSYKNVIENCYIVGISEHVGETEHGDIYVTTSGESLYLGGLVGFLNGDSTNAMTATIKNCYAIMDIEVEAPNSGGGLQAQIGGILGHEYYGAPVSDNVYFSGDLNITMKYGRANLIHGSGFYHLNNSFAITDGSSVTNATTGTTSNKVNVSGTLTNVVNCAYINKAVNATAVVKVGANQTEMNLVENSFKSVGVLRKAFGWDTNIWGTNVYKENGLPILRVFYNY